MFVHRVRRYTLALVTLIAAPPLLAQSGSIAGRVTSSEGGAPVVGARVQAVAGTGQIAASVLTRESGAYRIINLAPGTYSVAITALGYAPQRVLNVVVAANGSASADVTMIASATRLNPIVSTATRGAEPEKILESPNSISVVTSERIAERPSVTITCRRAQR